MEREEKGDPRISYTVGEAAILETATPDVDIGEAAEPDLKAASDTEVEASVDRGIEEAQSGLHEKDLFDDQIAA